jgi:hypothetical protein
MLSIEEHDIVDGRINGNANTRRNIEIGGVEDVASVDHMSRETQ